MHVYIAGMLPRRFGPRIILGCAAGWVLLALMGMVAWGVEGGAIFMVITAGTALSGAAFGGVVWLFGTE